MKKIIHINQHIIKRNAKTGERDPVITCKTYKSNDEAKAKSNDDQPGKLLEDCLDKICVSK